MEDDEEVDSATDANSMEGIVEVGPSQVLGEDNTVPIVESMEVDDGGENGETSNVLSASGMVPEDVDGKLLYDRTSDEGTY